MLSRERRCAALGRLSRGTFRSLQCKEKTIGVLPQDVSERCNIAGAERNSEEHFAGQVGLREFEQTVRPFDNVASGDVVAEQSLVDFVTAADRLTHGKSQDSLLDSHFPYSFVLGWRESTDSWGQSRRPG